VAGLAVVELYDTPGLEDSIGLLEVLDESAAGSRVDGIESIQAFLGSDLAAGPFAQEAKALRQVIGSDLVIYVIDVRDRVLAKHRDELEILGRCAVPVLPVLNFLAAPETRQDEWKEQLARVSMHAVAEFDTVVLDADGEEQLFRKMQTLVDGHRESLEQLIEHLRKERERLLQASVDLLAELTVDVAAFVLPVSTADANATTEAVANLRQSVREREQRCVDALLALNRFRLNDVMLERLPISDGKWGLDLFSREALRRFGVGFGGAAATGAAAGLAIDAMVAGLSLGVGALAGAIVGVGYQTVRRHGRQLSNRARGVKELRVDDSTLNILMTRQLQLVQALLRRGHASIKPLTIGLGRSGDDLAESVWTVLKKVRMEPTWSTLNVVTSDDVDDEPQRARALAQIAELFATGVRDLASDLSTPEPRP
jgi:hypothetical protein